MLEVRSQICPQRKAERTIQLGCYSQRFWREAQINGEPKRRWSGQGRGRNRNRGPGRCPG